MQTKWNQFVYLLREAKKKDMDESGYHSLIEQQLQLMGWFLFNGEICHKPTIHIGNNNHIQPDILLKKDGEEEFVIEVKRPSHKLVRKDVEQLQSYMRQLKLSVGIYVGEHIEVFYDMAGSKDAVSVLKMPLELDCDAGAAFADQFSKESYDRARVLKFCKERVAEIEHQEKLNQIKARLVSQADEQIREALLPYLTTKYGSDFVQEEIAVMLSSLSFEAVQNGVGHIHAKPRSQTTQSPASSNNGNVWLICYDSSYFKVADCFKKYGQVYWTHKAGVQNVRKGDIAYLYASRPESAIRFKVEVVASQLPYSPEMDVEDEFAATGSANSNDTDRKYFLVRPIAETDSQALKHAVMHQKGLIGKRPSATKLSKPEYKKLREYIEQHFGETAD